MEAIKTSVVRRYVNFPSLKASFVPPSLFCLTTAKIWHFIIKFIENTRLSPMVHVELEMRAFDRSTKTITLYRHARVVKYTI